MCGYGYRLMRGSRERKKEERKGEEGERTLEGERQKHTYKKRGTG